MNKIQLTILILSSTITIQAQNVGIGTLTPTYKLHIEAGANPLNITGGGAAFPKMRIDVQTPGDAILRLYDFNVIEDVRLATNGNSWYNGSGNFGIGTTSPSAKLDVVGVLELSTVAPIDPGSDIVRLGDGGTNLQIQTNYGYTRVGPQNISWSHFMTDRPRFYFDKGITVNTGLIGSFDENLSLQTSGATRITVLNTNGNVGIGTTAPSEKLHINGGIRISSLSGVNNRLVQSNSTGVVSNIADGTAGEVLTTNGAGVISWEPSVASSWDILGNAGTNPTINFLGTTDAQDLVLRTNNVENFRINTSGNVDIGAALDDARVYARVMNTDATTNYGLYVYHDGVAAGTTYGTRTMNYSSTNSTKYGIYNYTNNEGTGTRYGIANYTFLNSLSNATGYGAYNYLNSYGTGNHRASYNYLNHSGTGISTDNYASYNLMDIATSTNTSTLYGEYTSVDFSAGTSYGEYKLMNSNASYTSTMYGDYNQMLGTGNGTSYAVYNDFDNTGTGAKFGVRNEFANVAGTKYGVYNNFANGTATGTIYGVYNNIQADGNATKYGAYNYINGGIGSLRGSFNQLNPSAANTSICYGVYGYVSSAGTGTHYGGYFNAFGTNNRAVYATNTHATGWAGFFNGRGYFSGNVGVGTTAPTEKLHVVSDRILLRNGSDAIYCSNNTMTNYGFELIGSYPGFGAAAQRAIILGGYNQNNTNTQGYDDANRIQCGGGSSATLPVYATSHITTSSEKVKQNISALKYGLEEILKINPVTYQYVFDKTKLYKVGFIAEQVSKVIPEVVAHHDKEGNEVTREKGEAVGMDYSQMTAVLVNAVKEQQTIIDGQQAEIKRLQELEGIVKILQKEVDALKK